MTRVFEFSTIGAERENQTVELGSSTTIDRVNKDSAPSTHISRISGTNKLTCHYGLPGVQTLRLFLRVEELFLIQ